VWFLSCVPFYIPFVFLSPAESALRQGLIDLDAEIAKAEKKLSLTKLNLDKISKIEAQADYESTVPANVRLANEERVRTFPHVNLLVADCRRLYVQRKTLEAEVAALTQSKDNFAKLK
jgi:valyl-tRNA synthetase